MVKDIAGEETSWKDQRPFMLVGCDSGLRMEHLGENWIGFSHDGRFREGNYIALVTGFDSESNETATREGYCYELIVEYEDSDEFCFYTLLFHIGCAGSGAWEQVAPELRLVDPQSFTFLDRYEWRARDEDN